MLKACQDAKEGYNSIWETLISNIVQIIRKLPLSTLDTFMFNDAQSGLTEKRCYDVLDSIKEGLSIALKYSSEMIQFKTPYVVILF